MNIPGFNAEASLDKTSRHYQTIRQVICLSTQMIRAITPAAIKKEDEGVNCDTCVGAQCAELHCLEKWIHGGLFDGGGGVFGGGGGGGRPVEPCFDHEECSACVPVGPSIFSPGRQFCQFFTCQPTFSGGCNCQVFHKGFRSCSPFGDLVATRGITRV